MTSIRTCASATNSGDDAGMVLVVVLWSLILLSLITATAIAVSRTEIKARAALNQATELQARADGFVRLVALNLADPRTVPTGMLRPPINGRPVACRDGDVLIVVRVEDASGRVDLNAASQPLLELLLSGVGVEPPAAARLAARIVDYRDPDDTPGVGGAETIEYIAAGRTFGPKDSLFDSVDELDQVLGMTPEVLERLRPLATVHSRLPGIDPAVASREVLQALSGTTPGSSAGILQMLAMRSPARSFHIAVTASRGSRVATRAATIEVMLSVSDGFHVREWGGAGSAGNAYKHQVVDECPGPTISKL